MEPNWVLIAEILITLKINEKQYPIIPDNFPDYCSEELSTNLDFLTEIGLVDINISGLRNGERDLYHQLTFKGEELTDKLIDKYYDQLM